VGEQHDDLLQPAVHGGRGQHLVLIELLEPLGIGPPTACRSAFAPSADTRYSTRTFTASASFFDT
jgi:hypothetical protein